MRGALAALLTLGMAGCATFTPPDDWSRRDTVLQAVHGAALAADLVTTANSPPGSIETGTIARLYLGEHPTNRELALDAAMSATLSYLIATHLPKRWRPYFQVGMSVDYFYFGAMHNCERMDSC
ncbi:MAG TPA: hypothetical protein VFO94_00020 [Gammaproteobacteria bacterium]|nr:hypothetical protein [Gammaproteobacteria bacterium]